MNWENNLHTAEAARWADALRIAAFSDAEGGAPCGHGAQWRLPVELLLEMPGLLARALAGIPLELPEGPWPGWARTEHPIDWPALIAAAPDEMTWNHGMLRANMGARGDGIAAAYRILDEHGLDPYLDVCLWVEPDGRCSVEPIAMWSEEGDPTLSCQVDEVLVASGRPRARLRDDGDPWTWMLEA